MSLNQFVLDIGTIGTHYNIIIYQPWAGIGE